jgi:hypothetical protein
VFFSVDVCAVVVGAGAGIVPFRVADLIFLQVHDINSDVFGVIGEGKIMAPTIPVFLLPLLLLLMVIFF